MESSLITYPGHRALKLSFHTSGLWKQLQWQITSISQMNLMREFSVFPLKFVTIVTELAAWGTDMSLNRNTGVRSVALSWEGKQWWWPHSNKTEGKRTVDASGVRKMVVTVANICAHILQVGRWAGQQGNRTTQSLPTKNYRLRWGKKHAPESMALSHVPWSCSRSMICEVIQPSHTQSHWLRNQFVQGRIGKRCII